MTRKRKNVYGTAIVVLLIAFGFWLGYHSFDHNPPATKVAVSPVVVEAPKVTPCQEVQYTVVAEDGPSGVSGIANRVPNVSRDVLYNYVSLIADRNQLEDVNLPTLKKLLGESVKEARRRAKGK